MHSLRTQTNKQQFLDQLINADNLNSNLSIHISHHNAEKEEYLWQQAIKS